MTSISVCQRSVAYLKPSLSDGEVPTTFQLDQADSPVIKDLQNGLLVLYLVDEGEKFAYVQGRHLAEARMAPDELNSIALAKLARLAQGRCG